MRSERSETPGWQGDTRAQPTPSSQRCWRSYFFGSTIRSRSFCQKWIYNPIRSFHPPEKRIYDPILSDPFRSIPIRSLSCILKDTVQQILHFLNLRTCESERFISNEIARSHKIVILLRTANFNLKNAVCLWKITEWKIYFFIFQKILLSFVQKGSRKKSDPFRSDPWFFGSTIRSRSSRRKWIYDPITILKKEDLDPKGSRSDHDLGISASSRVYIVHARH